MNKWVNITYKLLFLGCCFFKSFLFCCIFAILSFYFMKYVISCISSFFLMRGQWLYCLICWSNAYCLFPRFYLLLHSELLFISLLYSSVTSWLRVDKNCSASKDVICIFSSNMTSVGKNYPTQNMLFVYSPVMENN